MILLAIASCLLFFITYFIGFFSGSLLKKWLCPDLYFNPFETFIAGLIASFIYFNLVSFFFPVNYISLLPLLMLSIAVFSKKQVRNDFFREAGNTAAFFFSKDKLSFSIPFIILLFAYWIIPPINWDSGEYHYISIRWYEQYKIIPGLANVHGRLAFNPANFIISAAWSFTDLIGQPIYPLNGVIFIVFYTWILKKILTGNSTLQHLIILLLSILMFRIALANISSPSADLLSGILLFYCGFRTYELIRENKISLDNYFTVIVITCFAVTAKLSAIPSLLLLPFIYFVLVKKNKTIPLVTKTMLLVSLVLIPWLIRNFILSGYFLYPVPQSNFFHVDWAVPANVIKLDYIFSKFGPRGRAVDLFTMQKMNTVQLTLVWFMHMRTAAIGSLAMVLLAILSPITWALFPLTKKAIPINSFKLWLVYYFTLLVWLINSPEYRFGLSYMLLAVAIPALEFEALLPRKITVYPAVRIAIMWCCCLFYLLSFNKKEGLYYFTISDCWLKPLRDHRYFKRNDIHTFPSVALGDGVTLYLPDASHECLNANGPCMNWWYGKIEMRGTKIENGFRNVKDEVNKYCPFVDAAR